MQVKKAPERMCLGCSQMLPKRELCRVVKNKEGEISLDFTGKKPGRGAYVCPKQECLQKAKKAKRFERAFSGVIPGEVWQSLEEELSKHEL